MSARLEGLQQERVVVGCRNDVRPLCMFLGETLSFIACLLLTQMRKRAFLAHEPQLQKIHDAVTCHCHLSDEQVVLTYKCVARRLAQLLHDHIL